MGSITTNLRLNVPDFDQAPWDVDVNTNWVVLDATVGMFSAIPNLVGVWKNSTAYMYGQSVIDQTNSSIWQCVQAHTSSASPVTFSQDRTSFPAYWTPTTPGAQYYATQAANAATAAAASAAAAAASAASIAAESFLPVAGGIMTGFITLNADPTAALHAVTKQYVDARVGGTGYLPIGGGTLTGPLGVGGNGIAYTGLGGFWAAHHTAIGWDGTNIQIAADGVYIGAMATQSYVSANFIPTSGGNVSGNLIVAGQVNAGATFGITLTGTVFHSDANYTYIGWDSGGWQLRYTRATGTLQQLNNTGAVLFQVDGSGNAFVPGSATVNGNLVSGNSFARGGSVYWGAGDRAKLASDNSTYTSIFMLDNYSWNLNWSTGTLAWFRYDGTALMIIDVQGNVNIRQGFTCAVATVTGALAVGTSITAAGGNIQFSNGGSGRIMQFQGGYYFDWNSANGDMRWTANGQQVLATSGPNAGSFSGYVFGNGAYQNISDIRGKVDVVSTKVGLAEILALEPIDFVRHGSDRMETGFSAQQLAKVIPSAVVKHPGETFHGIEIDDDDEPVLTMGIDPIVAALVNGMKELTARIATLEAR